MKKYFYLLATDQINNLPAYFVKAILLLVSWVYGGVVRLLLFCYQSSILKTFSLPKPVISIGNITLGGVGKTPLVETLVVHLKEKGSRPVVLIRGYMAETSKEVLSDEALCLKESLPAVPVLVGRDRVQIAKEAMKHHQLDCFVLDDGFQHWRLRRDLDIVLIDTTNPFGNGALIPRGILREPKDSLKRAHIFVLTKTDMGKNNIETIRQQLSKINSKAIIVEAAHRPVSFVEIKQRVACGLPYIKGKTIVGIAGIGDPYSFENSLLQLGADIKKMFTFIDHHRYTSEDVKQIIHFCRENHVATLVTTEKDAVKLGQFSQQWMGLELLSLKIKIEITKGHNEFFSRISSVLLR